MNYLSFGDGFGVAFPFGCAVGFDVGLAFLGGSVVPGSAAGFAVFDAIGAAGVGDGFAPADGAACALVFAAGGFLPFAVFAAVEGCCALAL